MSRFAKTSKPDAAKFALLLRPAANVSSVSSDRGDRWGRVSGLTHNRRVMFPIRRPTPISEAKEQRRRFDAEGVGDRSAQFVLGHVPIRIGRRLPLPRSIVRPLQATDTLRPIIEPASRALEFVLGSLAGVTSTVGCGRSWVFGVSRLRIGRPTPTPMWSGLIGRFCAKRWTTSSSSARRTSSGCAWSTSSFTTELVRRRRPARSRVHIPSLRLCPRRRLLESWRYLF